MQNTHGPVLAAGFLGPTVANGCTLSPGPGELGETIKPVERERAEERDQIDVAFREGWPNCDCMSDVSLTGRKLRQEMHEHVRDSHSTSNGEPGAARCAFEEAHRRRDDMHQSQT